MKKHFVVLLLFLSTISIADERIKFGVGSSNQRINDISFEFATDRGDLIRLQIDQITSKGQNIAFEIKDVNYFDYLKWITSLSSAEMRGFKGVVIISNENIDFNASIERTNFEIKNVDVLIDDENERVDLNSLDINYKLTNLEFSVPYFNDSEVDEFINTVMPDGKIPKVEFSVSYKKLDKTLKINGSFRMLSGNGIINVSVMINENNMDLTYVENSSIKLNNLADGLIDYIDGIEENTNFSVERLGRGSFKIEYSGLLKNIFSKYLDSISNAEIPAEDAVISSIRAGLKQYANNSLYETGRAEWPTNPFDALYEKPGGYNGKNSIANEPGEWTFFIDKDGYSKISHMRTNNSIFVWFYDEGINQGDNGKIGTLGSRLQIMD